MSLLIATPGYGGQVTTPWATSALALQDRAIRAGFDLGWLVTAGESLVTRARNTSVATFLQQTDYERLLFIDADIEFTPDDVISLWELDEDVAVGAYAMKRPDCPLSAWKDGEIVKREDLSGPTPVDYAGTGFMMIKRGVFDRMREANPAIEHTDGAVGKCWQFFSVGVIQGAALPEDFWFCHQWRALGGRVVLDPSIRLKHWGRSAYA